MVNGLGFSYFRHIWHFKAVRHVACEAHVKNGGAYAVVFNNIYNMTH